MARRFVTAPIASVLTPDRRLSQVGEDPEAVRIRGQNQQRLDGVVQDHTNFRQAMTQQLEQVRLVFQTLQTDVHNVKDQLQRMGGGFNQVETLHTHIQTLSGEVQSVRSGQQQFATVWRQEVDEMKIMFQPRATMELEDTVNEISSVKSKLQGMESSIKELQPCHQVKDELYTMKCGLSSLGEKVAVLAQKWNQLQEAEQGTHDNQAQSSAKLTALEAAMKENFEEFNVFKQTIYDEVLTPKVDLEAPAEPTALELTLKMKFEELEATVNTNFEEFKTLKQSLYRKKSSAPKEEKLVDPEGPPPISTVTLNEDQDYLADEATASALESKALSKAAIAPRASKICCVCGEPCAATGREVLPLPDGGVMHLMCLKCTQCGINTEPDGEITWRIAETLRKGTYACESCKKPRLPAGCSGRYLLTKEDLNVKPYKPPPEPTEEEIKQKEVEEAEYKEAESRLKRTIYHAKAPNSRLQYSADDIKVKPASSKKDETKVRSVSPKIKPSKVKPDELKVKPSSSRFEITEDDLKVKASNPSRSDVEPEVKPPSPSKSDSEPKAKRERYKTASPTRSKPASPKPEARPDEEIKVSAASSKASEAAPKESREVPGILLERDPTYDLDMGMTVDAKGVIKQVAYAGPADRMKIKAGTVIKKIDGELWDERDYRYRLGQLQNELSLTVLIGKLITY